MFGYITVNKDTLSEENKKNISKLLLWAVPDNEVAVWQACTDGTKL
mgnify:FL=1